MCKGIIMLCCENFIIIHSSIMQHKHLILYWGDHILFNNIQGCERGTAYTEAVIFLI